MIENSRFLDDEMECVLSMIEQELPHGSGIDCEWALKLTTPTRVNAVNSYHCMDEHGYYDGYVDFTVHFDIADKDVFRITFRSDYQNRKREKQYMLREYLEETISQSLQDAVWKDYDECNAPDESFTSAECLKCEVETCPVCGLPKDLCVGDRA